MRGNGISRARARKILSLFKGKRIAVVGDLMLDEYLWGYVNRVSPEAPVPVVEISSESLGLGGAANVAANLAGLGAEPVLFGVVGDDDQGRHLIRELGEAGIDGDGVLVEKGRATTVKTRIIAHQQQVVRVDRESRKPVQERVAKRLLGAVEAALGGVEAVIFEDYDKGVLTAPVIRRVIELGRENEIIVAADPKFDHFFDYRGVSLFKPNQAETERVLGIRIEDEGDLIIAGGQLLDLLGGAAVLITRGELGMILFQPADDVIVIPTMAREIFDVSGAGDTAMAALTLALTAGATVVEAAAIANHAAGIEVAKIGVAPVGYRELSANLLDGG
jgi:D-beta-D-heptose 7-phosphate kinase/D-beta-D-heptose 1-phosphate adenosyltransferase